MKQRENLAADVYIAVRSPRRVDLRWTRGGGFAVDGGAGGTGARAFAARCCRTS